MLPTLTEVLKEKYHDKKFNIIFYGVDECPKGTPKRSQLESDLNSLVSVLSGFDNTIQFRMSTTWANLLMNGSIPGLFW